MVLVTDQTLVIVFRCHGTVRSVSANPPQTSTTGSPSTKTATEAPASPASSNPASAFGTAVNRSSYEPWMSAMCVLARIGRSGATEFPGQLVGAITVVEGMPTLVADRPPVEDPD